MILALQSSKAETPCELLVDGDMFLLFRSLVSTKGLGICVISEVEGHADDEMVRRGSVRQVDKVGGDRLLLMSLSAGSISCKLVSIGIPLHVICTGSC